jgi:hypothetical protein
LLINALIIPINNSACYFLEKRDPPNTNAPIKRTRKIKNNILAIDAAPAAMPVKPNTAAIIAIMKNVAAHFNIVVNFKVHS